MNNFKLSPPSSTPIVDRNGNVTQDWRIWLEKLYKTAITRSSDSQVNNIDDTVKELRQEIDLMKDNIVEINQSILSLNATQAEQYALLNELIILVDNHSIDIQTLLNQVNTLTNEVNTLNTTVNDIENRVTVAEGDISTLDNQVVKEISSVGTGDSLIDSRVGNTVNLKSIKAGSNVNVTSSNGEITISSTGGGGGGTTIEAGENIVIDTTTTPGTSIIKMPYKRGNNNQISNNLFGSNILNTLPSNATGSTGNISFGGEILKLATSAISNIVIGYNIAVKNITNMYNVFIGNDIGKQSTGGMLYNVIIGDKASSVRTTPQSNNVIVGFEASQDSLMVDSVIIGSRAGKIIKNSNSQRDSVIIGHNAAAENVSTSGWHRDNVVIGKQAMFLSNGQRYQNVVIGPNAMFSSNSIVGHCFNNIAIGSESMRNATGAYDNVALGVGSLYSITTGYQNICLGSSPLYKLTTGSNNIAMGFQSLYNVTTGSENISFGYNAMYSKVSGSYNIAFGRNAGIDDTAGSYNTYIGSYSGSNNGQFSRVTAIGAYSYVSGSNQVQLGSSADTTYAYGAVQDRSDLRDKYDVIDTRFGLDFLLQLKVRDYKYDYRDAYEDFISDGSKKRKRYHTGFIAQEVKQLMDDFNLDSGLYQDHLVNGGKDVKSLGYQEFIGIIVKSVQEQQETINQLKEEIRLLKEK